jgi:hypothetical protein
MTTNKSALSEAILKNVQSENAVSGMAVANLIMAEANRREHLAGGVQSIQWERSRGIGVLVDDAGQMLHLSNALSLTTPMMPRRLDGGKQGVGRGRTGLFAGHQVTIWYVEI